MGALIGILGGLCVILFAYIVSIKTCVPVLIGPDESDKKDPTPLRTYTIINSYGEKQIIMTSKSMKELLSELNYLADKQSYENDNKN